MAKRYAKRYQFVDSLRPNGRESAGIVDIVAIRKNGKAPSIAGLRPLDLFDIILIRARDGRAALPTADETTRLGLVADHYGARAVALFRWQEKKTAGFFKLGADQRWTAASTAELFR